MQRDAEAKKVAGDGGVPIDRSAAVSPALPDAFVSPDAQSSPLAAVFHSTASATASLAGSSASNSDAQSMQSVQKPAAEHAVVVAVASSGDATAADDRRTPLLSAGAINSDVPLTPSRAKLSGASKFDSLASIDSAIGPDGTPIPPSLVPILVSTGFGAIGYAVILAIPSIVRATLATRISDALHHFVFTAMCAALLLTILMWRLAAWGVSELYRDRDRPAPILPLAGGKPRPTLRLGDAKHEAVGLVLNLALCIGYLLTVLPFSIDSANHDGEYRLHEDSLRLASCFLVSTYLLELAFLKNTVGGVLHHLFTILSTVLLIDFTTDTTEFGISEIYLSYVGFEVFIYLSLLAGKINKRFMTQGMNLSRIQSLARTAAYLNVCTQTITIPLRLVLTYILAPHLQQQKFLVILAIADVAFTYEQLYSLERGFFYLASLRAADRARDRARLADERARATADAAEHGHEHDYRPITVLSAPAAADGLSAFDTVLRAVHYVVRFLRCCRHSDAPCTCCAGGGGDGAAAEGGRGRTRRSRRNKLSKPRRQLGCWTDIYPDCPPKD